MNWRGPARAFARRAGLGKALWRFVYRPTLRIRWILSFGLVGAFKFLAGEAALRRFASRMPACPVPPGADPFRVTFMTGRRHWHHTLATAYSLALVMPRGVLPTFLDDGTLGPDETRSLLRVFPQGRVIGAAAVEQALARRLPPAEYPCLHRARRYVMGRKLIDLRIVSEGYQLYLDSDMLFFARPLFLEACEKNRRPCHMHDHGGLYYVRPTAELAAICGHAVQADVNGGIVGMDDGAIDWRKVEEWCRSFRPEELDLLLFEQTLTAMILSGHGSVAAPPDDYRIVFGMNSHVPPGTTLAHYLFRAKVDFFWRDWRLLFQGRG